MKRFVISLILMSLPFICFGQSKEADELEHKIQDLQAEIRHQKFLLENEMDWQKTMMEIEIDSMLRRYKTRMITERQPYNVYGPYMWEFTDHLYLRFFPPLFDELPLPYIDPEIED